MNKEAKLTEYDIQKWLAYLLGGVREVVVKSVGRVDILIKEEPDIYTIEVKKASAFLSAVGQVIGYTHTMQEKDGDNNKYHRILALYDFRDIPRERMHSCEEICKANDITVWWVDEVLLKFMYELEHSKMNSSKGAIKPFTAFVNQFKYRKIKR